MKKSKFFKVGLLLMLGVFVLGAAVPAMAGATGNSAVPNGQGFGYRAQTMIQTLADLTGLDVDAIRVQRQEGKSILDIAEDNGVDEDALTSKIAEQNQTRLKARLDDGTITEDQYNQCIENMDQRIQERLERTAAGGFGMGRKGAADRQNLQRGQRGQGGNGQRGQGNGVCPFATQSANQ